MAKKAKFFTDAEEKLLQDAASSVWNEVAYDCLQATADDKGKDIERVSMRRSVVIEVSLDAGRPEEKLRERLNRARRREQTEEVAQLEALLAKMNAHQFTYEQLIAAVKPAFPYASYGL